MTTEKMYYAIRRAVKAAILKKWRLVPNEPDVTDAYVSIDTRRYHEFIEEVKRLTSEIVATSR